MTDNLDKVLLTVLASNGQTYANFRCKVKLSDKDSDNATIVASDLNRVLKMLELCRDVQRKEILMVGH